MSNEIRRRLTNVDKTQTFDSVIVNDGSKLRQITKNQLEKIINIDGVVGEVSGTSILIRDSAKAPFRGMKLFGKSEQVKTTGKNLVENIIYNLTYNGLTITKNDDKSFYVNGTATENCYFTINNGVELPEGRYILTGCDANGSPSTYVLYGTNDDFYTQDVGKGSEFAYTSELALPIRFAVYKGAVMKNVLIKPMLRLAEIEDDTYEPYSGGVASPAPSWPQEIKSVEDPKVKVYGKNLLKPKIRTETINGVTFTVNEDGSVKANGTATKATFFGIGPDLSLIPGENYVLSGCPDGGGFDTYMLYLHYKKSGLDVYNRTGESKFIARDEEFSTVLVVYEGVTVNNLVFHPMIRLSSIENSSFETYTEQIISVPHTLPGIPVTSGGNYVDADGQQWICDEVDLERGVYIQRVRKLVISGGENWTESSSYQAYSLMLSPQSQTGMCTHLNKINADQLKEGETGVYLEWSGYAIVQVKELFPKLGDFLLFLSEQYDNGTPFTIYYCFETPIETPLTDEELAAYQVATTNHLNTTILNDAEAHMEVTYSVDLKTYIEDFKNAVVGIKTSVTLLADSWTVSDDGYYFTQEVTVPNTTVNSKIDLQPTPEQMIYLLQSEISLFVANNNGTIVVYALNAVPEEDMTFNAIRSEVIAV